MAKPAARPEAAPGVARTAGAVACSGCRAPFTCGMRAGERACWCAELPALSPVPGRDCLCRTCLEKALAAAPAQRT
ncbi:MAG TPA: cysteine-rich CWC family protein [Burkholderiales bacterium]